jgi:TetR/AcrR family transcriptional regulator, transcriptional repressor of bet genes
METRREQIAQALLRLVTKGGIEAVSMRSVAEEAKVSLGMVQRHFSNKEAMLHFAMQYSVSQLEQRFSNKIQTDTSPKEALFLLLSELCLVSPQTRGELQIWLSFLHQAVSQSAFAPHLVGYYKSLLEVLVYLEPNKNKTNAYALLALADGLTIQRLLGIISHEEAVVVLQNHLDWLFS